MHAARNLPLSEDFLREVIESIPGGGPYGDPRFAGWWRDEQFIADWILIWCAR